ncbi:MAG TPA: acylphosphatase [Opitutaceae bacterium]|nr:acylphosphatase [Opitutaceae bacterium]
MPEINDVHREIVFFSGHVQGVGFRYATLQVAKEFEIAGFVQNLADGRVEVQAEGRASEVNAFITALEEKMHGYIRKTERQAKKGPPTFSDFVIR